ncbi:UNVERIFIED_CONTAM: nicotinamide n-methyltransferase, partial [Siphonaria sp. JEL0065]
MTEQQDDSSDDSDIDFDTDMFAEPEGFRPSTPPPVSESFERDASHVLPGQPSTIDLQMIGGRDSLWAHKIWNGGVVLAKHIDKNKERVVGKRVLELGAAAALPSLISALNGAECVVATDYPEPRLISTIKRNCLVNCPTQVSQGTLKVVPHQWGQDLTEVLTSLPDDTRKFDVIYLADLIFNHTEHRALLKTCLGALQPGKESCLYVYFSHHNVHWADKDMKFFEIAQEVEFGFTVEKIDAVRAEAMFPDDTGDIDVRTTVHCYKMQRE